MSLSRRQKKNLNKLRDSAEELWHDQQAVLERANLVLRDAGAQAAVLTREEVVPRVKDAYETRLKPSVEAGRAAAGSASSSIAKTVVPAVGSAVGTALAVADAAADARNKVNLDNLEKLAKQAGVSKKTIKQARKRVEAGKDRIAKAASTATKVAKRNVPQQKSGMSGWGVFGIVVAAAAAAGIGYAIWQTLRADDDLWVADDEPAATN